MRFFVGQERRDDKYVHRSYSISLEMCKECYWLPDEIARPRSENYFQLIETQGPLMSFAKWYDNEVRIVNQMDRSHQIIPIKEFCYEGFMFMNVRGSSFSKLVSLSRGAKIVMTRTAGGDTKIYPLYGVQEDEVVESGTLKGDLFYIAVRKNDRSLAIKALDVNTGQMGMSCDMLTITPATLKQFDQNGSYKMLWYGSGKLLVVGLRDSRTVVLLSLDTETKLWEEVSSYKPVGNSFALLYSVSILDSIVTVNLQDGRFFSVAFDMKQLKWDYVLDHHLFGFTV